MKRSSKIIAFILAVFMLCTFAACSKKNEHLNDSQTVSAESAKEKIKTEIDRIESEYTNESGYISRDKTEEVIKKVYEFLLKKSEETKLTELGTECIYVKFKDDSGYVYQPRVEGYKLNGDNINITTLQPYFTEFGKQNSPDEAALSITKSVPNAKFNDKDNLDDAKVTVNAIKSLNNYKIIIWDGHGGYAPTLHSFMSISVPYKKIKELYYDDCKNNIFIESSDENSTILTVKFFEKYFNDSDFDGAVLYLGTCLSAADDILAKTFISKGASCVFGNTDVTTVAYDSCMMKSVFSYLSKGESSKKALNKSIKENESKKHGVKTDVVMYGDFNLTLKNMGNVNTSNTTKTTDSSSSNISEQETFLVANKQDLASLDEFIKRLSGFIDLGDYDSSKASAIDVMEKMTFFEDIMCYDLFFDYPDYANKPDPKNKAYHDDEKYYYKCYSSKNVDWIIKNIFNVEKGDAHKINTDYIYYYQNSYYCTSDGGHGGEEIYYRHKDCKRLSDGKYKVDLYIGLGYDFSEESVSGKRLEVALKEINGKRQWVLYKITGSR